VVVMAACVVVCCGDGVHFCVAVCRKKALHPALLNKFLPAPAASAVVFSQSPAYFNFSRLLLKVPEHTW
jgi:hypothetical protein